MFVRMYVNFMVSAQRSSDLWKSAKVVLEICKVKIPKFFRSLNSVVLCFFYGVTFQTFPIAVCKNLQYSEAVQAENKISSSFFSFVKVIASAQFDNFCFILDTD